MGKLKYSLFFFIGISFAFFSWSPQVYADATSCDEFQHNLRLDPKMSMGFVHVPKNYDNKDAGTIPIFYWMRSGKNPQQPPLLLLHGGPGGNSWFFTDVYSRLFWQYPGDIFVIDARGDGCSGAEAVSIDYKDVALYRSREVVKDLEILRQKFYPNQKWRALGQSRGSMILHYYLEMYPEGLESVHAHGFSFRTAESMAATYTILRLTRLKELGDQFEQKYPIAAKNIKILRKSLTTKDCWLTGSPHPGLSTICGPTALDLFDVYLPYYDRWSDLSMAFSNIFDEDGNVRRTNLDRYIRALAHGDPLISHLSLEIGVFDFETSYLNYQILLDLKNTSVIQDALFYEGRFMIEKIMPQFEEPWTTSVDTPNFEKIKNFLSAHPDFKFYLYASQFDPISPPELADEEVALLTPYVQFTVLTKSGHDGFYSEAIVQNRVLQ